jgi:hypothetical protein
MKKFKEYLGLPTVQVGGLDSINPIASLGDTPPKGKGTRDSRATGLVANYDTQAPGTMRPFLTAQVKKIKTPAVKPDKRSTGEKPVKLKKKIYIQMIIQEIL